MKRTMAVLIAVALLATLPLTQAMAMHHGKKSSHDHGHGHNAGHEEMVLVGEKTVEGVRGEAHLNDVEAAMKKAGMPMTHHFMIHFEDHLTKEAVTEGRVALRVTDPEGNTSNPVRLIGMDGHFGADITLTQKGDYVFEVGSNLPDGKTRQFEFAHKLE
jgi:hypothetical protein